MNNQIIDSIKKDIYEYIHTNIPARIIDFNHIDMTATVQIIAKLKIRGIEQIPKAIYKVPVGHSRSKVFGERNPLQKDDIVYLSFSEVSLEKILSSGTPEGVLGDSKFDLTDAVITTHISLNNSKMSPENKDDWCLFNFETGHKLVFKKNGELEIFNKKLTVAAEESIDLNTPVINAHESTLNIKKIVATDSVSAKGIILENHKHGDVQSGPNQTGGPE